MDYPPQTMNLFSQFVDPDQYMYNDPHHGVPRFRLPPHQPNMMNMQNGQRTNETKPRLGREEVLVLEREFKRCEKPTTQVKRMFAEDMGVDLSRINNWFQNRRAKRKQEKKTEAYEAGQAREALGLSVSAPSSPEFSQNNYNVDYKMVPQQQPSMAYSTTGPPPMMASYHPQYPDPPTASLESLSRTVAAAQAAQAEEFPDNFGLSQSATTYLMSHHNMPEPSDLDSAQFPTQMNYQPPSFNIQSSFGDNLYHEPKQMESFVGTESGHTPTAFSFDLDSMGSLSRPSVQSQAMAQSFTGILPCRSQDNSDNQGSDHSNEAIPSLAPSVAWPFQSPNTGSSSSSPSNSSFKPPPPPTDLAARRKKKPAALGTDTMRGRPSVGPRTMSNIDGTRRQIVSPLPSTPMRRIASASGNVLSGRIQKSGIESAQRSPINVQGFEAAWMEQQNYGLMNQPSLTAGSSLTSSLAPPTPMSPREKRMRLKREDTSSNEDEFDLFTMQNSNGLPSPVNNHCIPIFTDPSQAIDQTPPETPQDSLGVQQTDTSNWPDNLDNYNPEQPWNYDVNDTPLYTPNHDTFGTDLSMPHTSFSSQPVTPAFGNFNQTGFLPGNVNDSPPFNNNASPSYTLSNQGGPAEYTFPNDGVPQFSHMGMVGSSPTLTTKQKQYQFSNVTPADYSEK